MSAYVVDRHHCPYLVAAMVRFGMSFNGIRHLEVELAQMLWDENMASVLHRYDGDRSMMPDNCTLQPSDMLKWNLDKINPVQAIKSVKCYIYQSCEHPGWEKSQAKEFCERLIHAAIEDLHGYDEAEWGAPNP